MTDSFRATATFAFLNPDRFATARPRACRAEGRIVSVAVTIAVGVNSDGRHEVLGMATGGSEAATLWTDFLRSLARRGLRGVKLVIADAHEGLTNSIRERSGTRAERPSSLLQINARDWPTGEPR